MKSASQKIELRPAGESDRKKIYAWLAQSDITSSMMGPPRFPEYQPPSWEEFCREYTESFFNNTGDGKGRNYIILARCEEVGTVGYDLLDNKNNRVVLDIWMRSEKYCGQGYGSEALSVLCAYVYETYGITNFIISPSARNARAVAAYKKSGFETIKTMSKEEQKKEFGVTEYEDSILMIKRIKTSQVKRT